MPRGEYTFSQVPRANVPRSVFNRNHQHKTTFDAGWLIPFYCDEVLPGDSYNVRASLFGRLATPVVPVMDNLYLDVFWFFIPNRLVWDNWQKFCGEQRSPGESIDFLIPQCVAGAGGFAELSIYDYFGIPTKVPNLSVNCLPLRGYHLVYQEWFRDQNITTDQMGPTGDGPQTAADFNLLRRAKRHDYFTSCLPWPQKGAGVELPLGTTAPVKGLAWNTAVAGTAGNPGGTESGGNPTAGWVAHGTPGAPANAFYVRLNQTVAPATPEIYADLSQATSATINSLREAFQIQKFLERDARGGTRYVEKIKAHFGVESPDARLQRPEFLGGGSIPISINPVMQTSGTAPDPTTGYSPTPQGNLAAFGTVSGRQGFSKSFVEHGYVLGLVMVRAELTYQQGLNRMWSRRTQYDFYWPAFAHLGEQAVLRKEIFATGVPAQDDIVFGYQERWAEYRYHPSIVSGRFRSNATLPLDVWHLAQTFPAPPILDNSFIFEDPPIDRVIAVADEPHVLFDSYIQVRCARPMPLYSVPGLIDHF